MNFKKLNPFDLNGVKRNKFITSNFSCSIRSPEKKNVGKKQSVRLERRKSIWNK